MKAIIKTLVKIVLGRIAAIILQLFWKSNPLKTMLKIVVVLAILIFVACCGGTPDLLDPEDNFNNDLTQQPECRPLTRGIGAKACVDIESNSHAVYCPSGAKLPEGYFTTEFAHVICWCHYGECPGVLDCRDNFDCSWSQNLNRCQRGICVN